MPLAPFTQEFLAAIADKDFRDSFQKLVSNGDIIATGKDGGTVSDAELAAAIAAAEENDITLANLDETLYKSSGLYQRLLETGFLNLAKLITGKENPTGYTAKSLHDAFVQLIKDAVSAPGPEDAE